MCLVCDMRKRVEALYDEIEQQPEGATPMQLQELECRQKWLATVALARTTKTEQTVPEPWRSFLQLNGYPTIITPEHEEENPYGFSVN